MPAQEPELCGSVASYSSSSLTASSAFQPSPSSLGPIVFVAVVELGKLVDRRAYRGPPPLAAVET